MLKSQLTGLNAAKLRILLLLSIVVLIVVSATGFWFFRNQLDSFAKKVQTANNAATVSNNDITRLQQLKQELEEDKVAVTRAKNIVADSTSYQYQDQIIKDITAYAKASKVTITSFTFDSSSNTGGTTSGATTGGAAAAGGATAGAPAPAGLKTITTTIAIKSPVDYTAILNFIHSIELNLTKMQLTGISLLQMAGTSTVAVNPLTIEVYVR